MTEAKNRKNNANSSFFCVDLQDAVIYIYIYFIILTEALQNHGVQTLSFQHFGKNVLSYEKAKKLQLQEKDESCKQIR